MGDSRMIKPCFCIDGRQLWLQGIGDNRAYQDENRTGKRKGAGSIDTQQKPLEKIN